LHANPLDLEAARLLFQAHGKVGNADGQQRLAAARRLMARAIPVIVPREPWFSEPKPKGNELASILILCCNQLESTRRFLDSLLRQTRTPYEVILIDNGSTDGTAAYLEEFRRRPGPARVEIIHNGTNLGFARGCNQALARARGRYLVFLHNDSVVTPGWLDGLIRWSIHDWPNIGLVGPVTNGAPEPQGIRADYQNLEGLDPFAARRRREFTGRVLPVKRLTSFCLLARREVMDQIGPFDERYELGFFDDDDLCLRVREAGFRLLVAQDQYVHHDGNRTFQGLGINARELLVKNFERFKAKWGQEHSAGYFLPPEPKPAADQEKTPVPLEVVAHREASEGVVVVEDGPKVSLCMIVKNEEKNLPDCLRSVAGLFGEINVLDTGSTDRTKEIAREHGARVFDFPWADSFGLARNECLKYARGKWILWLDADDRIDADNAQRLRKVLDRLENELDAYAMKVRSVMDPARTGFRLLDQVRLFRNLPDIRWDYRIHEQILPAVNRLGGGVRWADVTIDHVGYQEASARHGKLVRNLRLLEMDEAERPDDSFSLFNLGWTLLDLGRAVEAMPRLRRSLEKAPTHSSILRKLYHLLAIGSRQLQQPEEAVAVCADGLRRFPDDGELLLEQGLLLRDRGDLDGAERSWLQLLEGKRGNYFASEEVGMRGYKTRQLLAEIYLHQSRLIEAEIQWRASLAERADFEPAWMGLAEIYLRHGRLTDLDELLQGLEDRKSDPAKVGWLRARCQVQRRELDAARKTLDAVINLDPRAVGPRVLISHVLIQDGKDWGAAEKALHDILALDANNQEAKHNLQVLRRNQSRSRQLVQANG
jgi:GT2 family glycosyltransferase/tetratricopeptide (TPR) repeat protein